MKKICLFLGIIFTFNAFSQDDLMALLEEETKDSTAKDYVIATFKSPRIINGHSIEMPAKNELIFIISHRFGRLNGGAYEFFGLDQATIRLGLEYSPIENLCFGIGRSTYKKNFDGFVKWRFLRQSTGYKASPITMVYLATMSLTSLKWENPDRVNYFTSRLSYTHQILIARKFNKYFSLQLMPTLVHKNLVQTMQQSNDIFAMGVGGRIKITNRIALTGEYYYLITDKNKIPTVGGIAPYNSLALGVDIETGGHVFQLQFTNSQPMYNTGFITETNSSWSNGGVHFGFNITRTFSL
ncbi:MAG: hypothetical protein D6707_07615 [Bacteroidetes bacterium]|nr:MAG: hypothetical protein D6707_07615 [Bacteroidota bacterium]